jgi:hypothetical protein
MSAASSAEVEISTTCPVHVKETAVVAIIEGKEEAGGALYIEFKVYQSPTDPNRALASWRFLDTEAAIDQSKLGNTI